MTIQVTTPTILDVYSRVMVPDFKESDTIGVPTGFQSMFGGLSGNTIVAGSSEDVDIDISRGELFQDREHELLLAHGVRVFDFDLVGEAQKLRRLLGLQILQLHFFHVLLLQTCFG